MSDKYKICDIDKAHLITLTTVGWMDVLPILFEKLAYIHTNPVEDMMVYKAEDYMFSSARNYAGLDSVLDVCLISRQWETYG